jgi:hypothetical protein
MPNPIFCVKNLRIKISCSNKKAPRENGAPFRALSREGLGQMQAGAGLLTFGPSAAEPEIRCGDCGSEGAVRSVKFPSERPFPVRLQNIREASGRSHFTAPADYSGGTVADFHGLPVPPAKSIFIRSLCGAARSVNRAPSLKREFQ